MTEPKPGRRRASSLLAGLVLALGSARAATAQTARDFAGTYDLVRVEALDDSGRWVTSTSLFGPDPVGIIMYDGIGSMSVHISRRDRFRPGTSRTLVDGYMAYYGRYEVDAPRGVVIHRRENHIDARQATVVAERAFAFDGDLLTLTVIPGRALRLVWRKRA